MEICHNGQYRAICADSDEGWDNRDAMVVCRELGFSPYGKLPSLHVVTQQKREGYFNLAKVISVAAE